ncbi:hypothetical protein QWM81_13435 [Streptomyces ficellus]|uniref:Uncharacterized protein n=1 Tax=Streptomyces ficellus TaxID=1977088 RepID=A0ABT7Z6B0_9ACTN|nr:hypothetical protein [Streptomyces ficellus]MDN3295037.1 hypothetical protein [Streptomyces ficellus]
MTQSGQGQEPHLPAARPAHEGVVLPAEGGETWGAAAAGPAGGQPWGGSWGPPGGQQQQPQQPGAYGRQPEAYPQQQPYGTVAQPLPPEVTPGSAADADATQYIPPVAQGAGPMPMPMPAPMPAENPAESTQYLGARQTAHQGHQAHAGPDADATQYIPPVPPQPSGAPYGIRPGTPGERQPPAEFDSLFRDEAAAGATQHMPRYEATAPHQQPHQHQAPQAAAQPPQPYQGQDQYQEARRRRSSKLALIAGVVVGCAVLGLGAGALLSGGEEAPRTASDTTGVVAAGSPTPGPSQEAADPARTQAEELDKLLADSSSSRDTVIRSVENIKKCQNLDQAVTDLRGAAEQRRGLVTRLQGLAVDRLPNNAELSSALTRAWQASASADDHYAAWAAQVKGKKGCKGGKARHTSETVRANAASGEATTAKRKAAALWNGIAGTYGLTPRQPTQL